jgi:hypothetical protein
MHFGLVNPHAKTRCFKCREKLLGDEQIVEVFIVKGNAKTLRENRRDI